MEGVLGERSMTCLSYFEDDEDVELEDGNQKDEQSKTLKHCQQRLLRGKGGDSKTFLGWLAGRASDRTLARSQPA